MNKITKIYLLSVCLLTQQSYGINPKFLFYGYIAFFSSLCLVPAPSSMYKNKKTNNTDNQPTREVMHHSQVANEYQDVKKDWYNWNDTSNKQNKAYHEHEQFLEEKFNNFPPSNKFLKYQKSIINEWNEVAEKNFIDTHNNNIKSLKNLTSLYSDITECLKTAIEELAVSDKTYDSCFEYALSEQEKAKE